MVEDDLPCFGLTDLFFPPRGDQGVEARRICGGCPVRLQCLQGAVERGEEYGIWGGLSEAERRPLVRKLRREQLDRFAAKHLLIEAQNDYCPDAVDQ